jgi:hypothetical protein
MKPVLDKLGPMFGEDTFRVKLKPSEVKLSVTDRHNLLVRGSANDFQFTGKMRFVNHPRMVSSHGKLGGETFK